MDTSCEDWEDRILTGRSLVPELPLFKAEAAKALRVFKRLRVPDMIGTPTLGEICGLWFLPIVEAVRVMRSSHQYPAYQRAFLLIPKGNGKSSLGGAVMVTAMIVNRRPKLSSCSLRRRWKLHRLPISKRRARLSSIPS
jgi:phage terminase large subunit-like protein